MGYGRSKPQPGSQLRCGDGLAAGLRAAVILNEGAGALCRDALGGPFSLSGHTWVPGSGGPAVRFGGSGIGRGLYRTGITGAAPRTLAFVATLDTTDSQAMAGFGDSSGSATGFYAINFGGTWYFNAINSNDVPTGVTADTHRNLHVLRYTGTTFYWSINGVVIASGNSSLSTVDTPLCLGCRANSSTFPMTGSIEWAMAWARVLSKDEESQLFVDPFAMFRPLVRRVYSVPSGVVPTATRLLNLRRKMVLAA